MSYEEKRQNSDEYKIYQHDYDIKNKPRRKAVYFQSRYGLSELEILAFFIAQGSVCAICKTDNPGGRGWFHVDHNHKCCPGKKSCGKCVRGLLCHKCNIGQGHFDDDPLLLLSAATYLKRSELFTEGLGI